MPPRTRASGGKPLTAVATQRTPSLRSLTSLILRDPSLLSETETQTLAKLQSLHPHLDTTIQFAQSFAAMVRQHQKERLDPWLEQAAQAGLSQWRSFAQGLAHDRAAVAAALETHWSNGPTKGHVNRLKCIKRQMYGRAKLDLVRVRLLPLHSIIKIPNEPFLTRAFANFHFALDTTAYTAGSGAGREVL